MIDVNKTIFSTIKDKIEALRFLGKNDSKSFKKVLGLIILDDLYRESDDRLALNLLEKLKKCRFQYILDNSDFTIEYVDRFKRNEDTTIIYKDTLPYTNVNTNLDQFTWRRVWDEQDVLVITEISSYNPHTECKCKSFTPDPSCTPSIIIFPSATVPAHAEGKYPDIDIDSLTICDRMNIYFNKDEKLLYFLDPKSCTWEKMYEQAELPTIPNGVEHTLKNNTMPLEEDDEVLLVYLKDTEGNPMGEGSDVIVKNENYLDQVLP